MRHSHSIPVTENQGYGQETAYLLSFGVDLVYTTKLGDRLNLTHAQALDLMNDPGGFDARLHGLSQYQMENLPAGQPAPREDPVERGRYTTMLHQSVSAGGQLVVRVGYRDEPATVEQFVRLRHDPESVQAELAGMDLPSYRLYLASFGQIRCRAVTCSGKRCKHERDLWGFPREWSWQVERGSYCHVHEGRRQKPRRRLGGSLDASMLEPEGSERRPTHKRTTKKPAI